jgi:hypothetical protein
MLWLIKMLRSLFLVLMFSVISIPAFSQKLTEFKSIDLFLQSLTGAELRGFAEGDLFGGTSMDWAGIVASTDQSNEEITEIYILEKRQSGNYRVVEKSASRSASGGTGNYGFEDVSISNKSVFVVFSYHWHNSAGNSTSQFKLTKNGWQLIGIESFDTDSLDGSGVDVRTSSNLLTGNTIIKKTDHGKHKISKIKVEPKLILLRDYNGDDTISTH